MINDCEKSEGWKIVYNNSIFKSNYCPDYTSDYLFDTSLLGFPYSNINYSSYTHHSLISTDTNNISDSSSLSSESSIISDFYFSKNKTDIKKEEIKENL